MDSQILLNVNFCNEVYTRVIEKNDISVYVRVGYSVSGIRLVPQENVGICLICMNGHIRDVCLGQIEAAVNIEESCSFISVELDLGFNSRAMNVLHSLYPFGRMLTDSRDMKNKRSDASLENVMDVIADYIDACEQLWSNMIGEDLRTVKQADSIYAVKGKISISELAGQMGCTVRHAHRRFVKTLGVGPKRFVRIVRVRETVRKMLEHPGGHVTDYMDDMGYSDQAHFQREFKWYTGMTPGSMLKLLN